jgi:PAP2 superfamily
MRAIWRALRLLASAAMLAFLVVLMLHFHVAAYPYLAFALAGSFVIYLWSRPSAASLAMSLGLGAGFMAAYALATGEPVLLAAPAFLGLGSVAALGLAALWFPPDQRQASLDTCLTAAVFPMFLIAAGFSLAVTTVLHPKTLDLYLYAFDGCLGFQPSFAVGRLFSHFAVLRQVCYFGYEALPLAMAIAFALERRHPSRAASLMAAFMVAAGGGFLLYNVYPAAGPIHIFGKLFPNAPPAAVWPVPVAAGNAPRNAMPSVHMTMALLILWNSRVRPRLWRWVASLLLVLTALATLGFGEHYLADLLVAVPFALAAQALAASGLGWRTPERIGALAAGALLVLAWLLYLRSAGPFASPPLAWMLLAGGALLCCLLEARLSRACLPIPLPDAVLA